MREVRMEHQGGIQIRILTKKAVQNGRLLNVH
jgi:hypothetical protein